MRSRRLIISAALALGVGAVAALPALPAAGKSISSSNLKALTNSINRAKHLTYMAEYTSVNGGQKETVTVAQQPPKSNFSTSGGSVINDGKSTYYCSSNGGSGNSGNSGNSGSSGSSSSSGSSKQQCLSVHGTNPLLALENLLSPAVALSAFAQAKQGLISRFLGIKVSSSSETFAGQPSTCVTVTVHKKGAKYCVTKQGILSYSGTSSTNYFELTSYSSKPPSSLFSLPAGATTATVPGSVTVP
jgi:hypothetical protein